MKKDIVQVFKTDEVRNELNEIMENAFDALTGDLYAVKNLFESVCKLPISFFDQLYWQRFINFIEGTQKPLGEAISVSNKLFSNDEKGHNNALRIMEVIKKIDNEKSLDFIVNATRSCMCGWITTEEYFRIIKAITETLYEDLLFLSEKITTQKEFIGNIQIHALERSGLMIQIGIDANASVEAQSYVISTLGDMVDQYAISLNNEDRFKWHKENKEKDDVCLTIGISGISEKDIDEIIK